MTKEVASLSTCTTCPYCGVGCGVIASVDKAQIISVKGDESHPANFGKLCSKGSALAETLGDEDRLLYPHIKGQQASWDDALETIAKTFSNNIEKHGPDSVAFYVSGQCLTEDYYIANKLMKGFIGSGNIDTNSRLCMASSVVGHKRAFGADIVPGCYEDLEQADLLVLTGSNLAWCHPVLYQRILAAKANRPEMKIVVIDPRKTATCDLADIHLAIAPGGDVPLFLGLFKYLDLNGFANKSFIDQHTENHEQVLRAAVTYDLKTAAKAAGLPDNQIDKFYELFAHNEKVVTIYSQGVNQARDGCDKVNTIINCHLLTGRIGKIGAGPFSVTGQPNAMGGREVGGLANQLACHMEIANPEHRDIVQRYWESPKIADKPGLLAVDMFEAMHAGKIKAVWIMATNPVDSMPNADFIKEALSKCELVVISDIYAHTDTVACADIVLPATGWGEKDGTVTNSERRISRQKAFLSAPGEAKHDWWQLCEVAKRMGFERSFSFESPAEIFREYAGLCAFENEGTRDLDLSGLIPISDTDYDALKPIQWPVTKTAPNGTARFFENGRYYTKSGKANFIAPAPINALKTPRNYPFVMNTGRIRDQWHTMTRTGRSTRLSQHISEPFVEINPKDAAQLKLADAYIATLISPNGQMQARVVVTDRQREGAVFVPMHFTDSFAKSGRVDALVHNLVDPLSGQPASKSTAIAVRKYEAAWYGFAAILHDEFETLSLPPEASYWAKARTENGLRIELAGLDLPNDWRAFMQELLGYADNIDILDMVSPIDGQTRMACFQDGQLIALLYTSVQPVAVSRDWACAQLSTEPLAANRHRLLAGRPGADMPDKGAIICACMNIGVNEISHAISNGCRSIDAIGDLTTAGTNCGSCQPEIRNMLQEAQLVAAE
ncbi:MAG: nitrate reductase [Maricaulaceae bacterium]